MIDEIQQPAADPVSGGSNLLPKVLLAVLSVYILISGYLLFSMNQQLTALRQKQQLSESDLRQQLAAVRSDAKANATALAGQTQKQLEVRAAGLRREQKEAEARIAQQEQQRITAVTGEVAGVKTDVGAVRSDVASARADLEATRAKLERTIGDLGLQSGLIARTRDELDILKHKGDRNYYDFTLAKNAKHPVPVGTISLQLKKADAKKGKYTMSVLADDKTIEKKDRSLNEPVQFYSGKDHYLFELVVFTMDKDKVTGYLSTPKVAPAPAELRAQ